jgi:hypothetical protein
LKWDASKRWTYLAEIGYRTISYTGEDTVALASKRSGNGIIARLSAQNRAGRKYFNPTFALRSEQNSTDGTEFDNFLYGVQIINTMRLDKISFSQVFQFDRTTYGNSTTDRKDTLLTLSLLASRKIGPRWAILTTGSVSKNTSTDAASFSYDRFNVNAGFGYSF